MIDHDVTLTPCYSGQEPDFDGETYDRTLDHKRLTGQLGKVQEAMSEGWWWSLEALAKKTGAPEASVSARVRDLRKAKFGGFEIERQRTDSGLWLYRMVT